MSSEEIKTPLIDSRIHAELVAETETLIEGLTAKVASKGWLRRPLTDLDALGALVHLVSDISKQTIDSVNAIPGAGFSAYLDLIGARPAAPRSARVPLTFSLVEDSPSDAVVPVETQVGATPDPDSGITDELIFETEDELTVTRAGLLAALVHTPDEDTVDDVTLVARDTVDGHFQAFHGHEPGIHEVYISCSEVFSQSGLTSVEVRLGLSKKISLDRFPLQWARFDGSSWVELSPLTQVLGANVVHTFHNPEVLLEHPVFGVDGYWLRAKLDTTHIPNGWPRRDANRMIRELPTISSVKVSSTSKREAIVPETLLHGSSVVAATENFFPFSQRPEIGSTFYIDCGDALAQPQGAHVSLVVELGEAALDRPPAASETLRLVWEVRTETGGWTTIGRSSGTKAFAPLSNEPNSQQFSDQTLALTKSGRVEFRLPHTVVRGKTGQRRGRWLRVRVSRGDYGGSEHVSYNEQSQRYEILPATLAPPVLSNIRVGFEHSVTNIGPSACISNDLGYLRHHRVDQGHPSYKAFTVNPAGSRYPSLYICLDREVEQSSLSFFVDVLPPEPDQSSPDNYNSAPRQRPEIYWDYYGSDGWRRLGVKDTTSTFRERGTVRFIGPDDLAQTTVFGVTGRWLRIQWTRGEFRHHPRVSKILLNTVWASHCVTRRGETLGTGSSVPGQVFTTAAKPVLDDHEIDVRELLDPTEEELAELVAEVPQAQLELIHDSTKRVVEAWVRWSPVLHFHESRSRDRHYTLDSSTGTVVFGDGTYGMAVPRGQANIRLTRYRIGGGVHGNRPKGAVSELKTSIPYVDSVTNHVASSGGTSAEPPERVRVRGPMRLRHRERAVTPGDYEDLALEAAPEVVRAHAMLVPFNPIDLVIDLSDLDSGEQGAARTSGSGRVILSDVPEDVTQASRHAATVHVVIVPSGEQDQPAPSLGLLERVDSYLDERSSTAVRLRVSGPRWIKVTVTATIVPEEGADPDRLVVAVEQSIQRFLHPLTGGDDGEGWSFGRAPQQSHLFRRIDAIPGVHHVRQLDLATDPPQPEGGEPLSTQELEALRGALIYSGEHDISLAPGAYEEDGK